MYKRYYQGGIIVKAIQVTIAQLIPELGNKQHNLQLIQRAMEKAKKEKADLIVFPELFLTGYSVGDQMDEMAETIDEGTGLAKVKSLCVEYNMHAVISFPEKGEDGQYYITSAVITERGQVAGSYRKTHLFDTEKESFAAGNEFNIVETSLGKIGMMICFDVEFPEIARALKLQGADFIVIVNANMHPYQLHHHLFARARAMENEIPVVICNRVGKEGDLDFCGDSMVIDATGKILLQMKPEEGVKTVRMPVEQTLDPKMSYTANRRANLYGALLDQ